MSKVSNIQFNCNLGSQISLRFALEPAVFKLHAIVRKVHQNDPKMSF